MSNGELETPRDFVNSGWVFFQGLSLNVLGQAQSALNTLTHFNIEAPQVNVDYGGLVYPGTFVAPTPPTKPDLRAIVYVPPPDSPLNITPVVDQGPSPSEPTFSHLVYTVPGGEPGDAPVAPDPSSLEVTLASVIVPDEPTLNLPDKPTLLTVTIPPRPDLVMPDFLATRPVDDFVAPNDTFSFVEHEYSDALLDSVKARLIAMTGGGTGLPLAVEQAIFDRGRVREDMTANKAIQEMAEEIAARGFDELPGEFGQRALQIRQKNQDAVNTLSRDLLIKVHEVEIENIRFSITQGVACLGILVAQNNNINERALQAAKIQQDVLIALFNSKVQKLGIMYDGYKADASVFETRVRALGVRADIYKSEVDAQKAVAETNQVLVSVFSEEIKAELAKLEIYKAELDGKRLIIEINTQQLAQVRNRIEIYSEEVKAWGIGWEGYKTKVDASLAGLKGDEVLAQIYGTRVNAWDSKNKVAIAVQQAELQGEIAKIEKFKAQVQGAIASLQAQTATNEGVTRMYAADGSVYAASGEIAKAEADTLNRAAEIQMSDSKNRAEIAVSVQSANLQSVLKAYELTLESLKGRAAVLAQLAASVLSGAHFGANYSGNLGVDFNYSKSFGYSGGTPDASPTF